MLLTVARLFFALFVMPIHPLTTLSASVHSFDSIADEASTSVTFDSAHDLIIVTVRINGEGPFRFLVDTGASHHVMTPELARTLGVEVKNAAGAIGVGGKETISAGLVEVAEMQIGTFTLKGQSFFVTPFPASYPFQGFLGSELFKRFVVQIDYTRSLLTLTIPKKYHYEGKGVDIPIKLHGDSIPKVKANVDGTFGWFKLDTGYNGSLALFGKFIDEHGLLTKYAPQKSKPGGQTLAGEVGNSPVAVIRKFRLGAFVLNDTLAALFLEKEGSNSNFAGAIGTGIIKRYNIILNYPKRRMILEERGVTR